jgi:hypothetical protein
VSIQVVQHDVDVAVRVGGYNLIHEIQKLSPPPAMVMACDDLPGSDVESRKQGRGPVPRTPFAVCVPQTVQPPFAEALAPLRHPGGPGLQLLGNLQVGLSLMG